MIDVLGNYFWHEKSDYCVTISRNNMILAHWTDEILESYSKLLSKLTNKFAKMEWISGNFVIQGYKTLFSYLSLKLDK